jgi:Uma2 family endonuclease
MSATKTLITAEEFLKYAGQGRAELVRGEVVEMSPVGRVHGRLVVLLLSWIAPFVAQRKLGEVFTEVGFILFRNPDVVRAPDISFVAAARVGHPDDDGYYDGTPDLAVEVLSPDDRPGYIQDKIRDYRTAGCKLLWIADPKNKTVTVYHPSGAPQVYKDQEEVSGEDVLPGFVFRPADLFRLP